MAYFTSTYPSDQNAVISNCKGSWERQSSCVPRKKRKVFSEHSRRCCIVRGLTERVDCWALVTMTATGSPNF